MRTQQFSTGYSNTTYAFDIDETDESIDQTIQKNKFCNWTTVPVTTQKHLIVHDSITKFIKINYSTRDGCVQYNINNLVDLLPNTRRPHILSQFLIDNSSDWDQYHVDHVTISSTFKNMSNFKCTVGLSLNDNFYHPEIPQALRANCPHSDTELAPVNQENSVVNITISSLLNRKWRTHTKKTLDTKFSGYIPNGVPPLIEHATVSAMCFDDNIKCDSNLIVKCHTTFHFVITLFKNDFFHY